MMPKDTQIDAEQDLGLDDEERLPWLEAAEDYEDDGAVSPVRLVALVLGGLLLIGAVLGGLWWVQNGGQRGDGELIAAQKGDYKLAPIDDKAKSFEGEGDASFAASEGAVPTGAVDASRMPEEPATSPAGRAMAKAAASKAAAPDAAAKADPATAAAASATGGATIQLGAFSSAASAANAWTTLSKRFPYLTGLSKSVASASVDGDTVYRLRTVTGSAAQAASICAKLKVARENCAIVR